MEPKFATFNRTVDKKTSIIQTEPNIKKRWLENESKPIMNFSFLRIPSLISKDQKENIIYTMDGVRGYVLGTPHGTTPAAVIANKNKTEIP